MTKTNGKYKLSADETRMLTLLPMDGSHVDTKTLESQFFRNLRGRVKPFNSRIYISNLLRALVLKTKRRQLRVMRSRRRGPHATEAWLERR